MFEDINILETVYKEANAIGHHNYEGRNLLVGVQNGDETGVDCGGLLSVCPACPTPPSCTDGVQNGDETGVD